MILVLVALNIVGIQESARLNIVLAVVDFATQVLLVLLGFVLDLQPLDARPQRRFGQCADVGELRSSRYPWR